MNNLPLVIPSYIEGVGSDLYFNTPDGRILQRDIAMEIIDSLLAYYENRSEEDIWRENALREYVAKQERKKYKEENKHKHKSAGYVYIIKCGDKHKIGYSSDVERRLKQLDTRPYPIELVYKSKFLNYAYEMEQHIHSYYSEWRIDKEWYDFNRCLTIPHFQPDFSGEDTLRDIIFLLDATDIDDNMSDEWED